MQTPAERALIDYLAEILKKQNLHNDPSVIINLGAGKSVVIESYLHDRGLNFVSDRLDIEDTQVNAPFIRHSFQSSLSDMNMVSSNQYEAAFSNYVLEHVSDLAGTAKEIYRILKPGGSFVVSTPNPSAPEFLLSRITPLALHQWVRGSKEEHRAFETVYAYKTIPQLIDTFKQSGFSLTHSNYYPATLTYLYRFPVLRIFSACYDAVIKAIGLKSLLGNVCLVFVKD
jgi:SAM-dependent methyltransferase